MARATDNGFDTSGLADQYPRAFQLADGSSVELRVMSSDDRDAILGFAQALPEEDLLFLRVDLTEPDVVDAWVGNIRDGRMAALAAYRDDVFLGYAAVHRNPAPWMRHVGELRVNVAPAVRTQGLGRLLVSHVFDMARTFALQKLVAQMTTDQHGAQAAFRRLGFVPEALLADFVVDRGGRSRDLVMMTFDVEGLTDQAGGPVRI
ncbi:MAG: GNAT family N-acetyltransferase [Gammaproteobacteria bacterium]|nr:GNAT family N-acetyltransferase [Gammaproteobacteria bacterium]